MTIQPWEPHWISLVFEKHLQKYVASFNPGPLLVPLTHTMMMLGSSVRDLQSTEVSDRHHQEQHDDDDNNMMMLITT